MIGIIAYAALKSRQKPAGNTSKQNTGQEKTSETANNKEEYKVTIVNFSFQPNKITISPGESVTFTNKDSVAHTVTSDTGNFDSGRLKTNQSFVRQFNEAGTYKYHCSIHPNMTGMVVVK